MSNNSDITRNKCMLTGSFRSNGYDWWWHSLTAVDSETGEEKPFFIEYFLCNPALGGPEPIFGQLPENKSKKIKPSYLMVKAGFWKNDAKQLHRFFGWQKVKIEIGKTPYELTAEDCYASEKKIKGSIKISKEESEQHPEWMCDYGEMEWDLNVDKKIAYNVGFGANNLFQSMKAFEMYWHVEGMKTLYEGYIILNGKKYIVSPENCYGYADKNWGSNFTSPWVWLSSNDLTSKKSGQKLNNSVFVIGGGKPKIGPIVLDRRLLSDFYYEGTSYEFNFSKFWQSVSTEFDCKETEDEIIWHVEQKNGKYKMVTDVKCAKKDMLFINYESPDGEKRYSKLWNGGNGEGEVKLYNGDEIIDEVIAKHIGCEYGEYDKDKE